MITGFIVLGVQNLQHLDGGPLQDHHARRDGEGHSQAEPSRQCQAGWWENSQGHDQTAGQYL